ncbi:DUF4810 domain-containing protein [Leclercia adecarboxylata]|uniref:DUF4810 domain-containing protein n=1 Tax=Leclercia adecarboxylata TaxID=83655 RepID=UPI00202A995B|nr:DUF4810 domain-containing protein [Leclercia adecarboxylata]URN98708.1 DUF4810 domain-containing protein [Leclercia adecarboxylata]
MAKIKILLSGAAMLLLAGCATKSSQQIYTWGDYQDTIYDYYTNKTSPQDQIASLQKLITTSQASSKPVPPGVHAQLGMLYSNTGNRELAMAEFNAEKKQYPESASYIDFLTTKK